MANVVRSKQAQEDLIRLWVGLGADNPSAADRLIDQVESLGRLLGMFPHLGRKADEIRRGLRRFTIKRYAVVLFYELDGEDVVLVRVLDGRRDLPAAIIDE